MPKDPGYRKSLHGRREISVKKIRTKERAKIEGMPGVMLLWNECNWGIWLGTPTEGKDDSENLQLQISTLMNFLVLVTLSNEKSRMEARPP